MGKKIKVVYNNIHGGFSLSEEAENKLKDMLKEKEWEKLTEGRVFRWYRRLPRHDKRLVKIVEELGEKASGNCAKLAIQVLEGTKYRISEYDGLETVQEPNDIDWIDASKE